MPLQEYLATVHNRPKDEIPIGFSFQSPMPFWPRWLLSAAASTRTCQLHCTYYPKPYEAGHHSLLCLPCTWFCIFVGFYSGKDRKIFGFQDLKIQNSKFKIQNSRFKIVSLKLFSCSVGSYYGSWLMAYGLSHVKLGVSSFSWDCHRPWAIGHSQPLAWWQMGLGLHFSRHGDYSSAFMDLVVNLKLDLMGLFCRQKRCHPQCGI